MPRRKWALFCADCGEGMVNTPHSRPQGEARCHPCRRKRPTPRKSYDYVCARCGTPFTGGKYARKYCSKFCYSQSMQIRPPSDIRVRRSHREKAAPGLNTGQRYKLRDKRIAHGHRCAYCQAPADTIDHVVPLVRGGTNYEGNLVVCCRSCNSSKSGRTVMEWRMGKRAPQMTESPAWPARPVRRPKVKPPKAEHDCPICGTPTTRAKYCGQPCADESFRRYMRDRYRAQHGLPIDPNRPTKPFVLAFVSG